MNGGWSCARIKSGFVAFGVFKDVLEEKSGGLGILKEYRKEKDQKV